MLNTLRRAIPLFAMLFLCTSGPSFAQSMEEQGRAIFEQYKHAVVTVQLVIKQKFSASGMPSQEDESKAEVTGTVINPEGLTVLALSSTDPTSIYMNMMGSSGRDFQIDSSVSDVRILMQDGSEVPAQIILRDVDLDLAFVRPIERPATPFTHVNLEDAGHPQLMDAVVTLNRLSQVSNRVYAAAFERINAVVQRPRTFYVPGADPTTTEQGSPAFTLDGKPVGIFVIRSIRDTGAGRGMFGGNRNVTPIILPGVDILEAAEQAPDFGEAPVGEPETTSDAPVLEDEAPEEATGESDDAGDAPAETPGDGEIAA